MLDVEVGLEHPDSQVGRVRGSSPLGPTEKRSQEDVSVFYFKELISIASYI